MIPVIDKESTGKQIRQYMNLRGFSVQDVKEYLSLGCVQSVYHWLDGQALPTLDNLYALSEMLQVPMENLIVGSRNNTREVLGKINMERMTGYLHMFRRRMAA